MCSIDRAGNWLSLAWAAKNLGATNGFEISIRSKIVPQELSFIPKGIAAISRRSQQSCAPPVGSNRRVDPERVAELRLFPGR